MMENLSTSSPEWKKGFGKGTRKERADSVPHTICWVVEGKKSKMKEHAKVLR